MYVRIQFQRETGLLTCQCFIKICVLVYLHVYTYMFLQVTSQQILFLFNLWRIYQSFRPDHYYDNILSYYTRTKVYDIFEVLLYFLKVFIGIVVHLFSFRLSTYKSIVRRKHYFINTNIWIFFDILMHSFPCS